MQERHKTITFSL